MGLIKRVFLIRTVCSIDVKRISTKIGSTKTKSLKSDVKTFFQTTTKTFFEAKVSVRLKKKLFRFRDNRHLLQQHDPSLRSKCDTLRNLVPEKLDLVTDSGLNF